MKRGLFLLLGVLLMVSSVKAETSENLPNRFGFNYTYDNSVNFIERGVEFFIFTNGEFDFSHTNFDFFGRRVRANRNISIGRDYRGRINRVGSAFISYDRFGNVTRIGNVFMRYYRGRLTNVGDLRVRYNRAGYPIFYGTVRDNFYVNNGVRINLNIGDVCDYNDAYFFRNDFRRNYSQIREDNNYFYYRANKNAKIGKRSQILRRRKPATINSNRKKITNRRSDFSYRKPSNTNSGRIILNDKRNRNTTTRKPVTTNSRRTTTSTNRSTNNISRKPVNTNSRRTVTTERRNSNTSVLRKPNTSVKRDKVSNSRKIEKRKSTNRRRAF